MRTHQCFVSSRAKSWRPRVSSRDNPERTSTGNGEEFVVSRLRFTKSQVSISILRDQELVGWCALDEQGGSPCSLAVNSSVLVLALPSLPERTRVLATGCATR